MNEPLNELVQFIQSQQDFLLIAHTSPDGDTLGSCLALYAALQQLGKRAQVVCDCDVPNGYRFLPYAQTVVRPQQAAPYPNVIAVDCAAADRMGEAQQLFFSAEHTANIDHHVTNTRYAHINFVDPEAAATSELVLQLIQALQVTLDVAHATCLFTALSTDTGNFAYSNTTSRTLRYAAVLLDAGIDIATINRQLYRMVPLGKARLIGHTLCNMQLFVNGTLSVGTITLQDMQGVGASEEDTEGIIDHIRDVDTVEVAILIRESGTRQYRVSMRSKTCVDVGEIARQFQGGGHVRAAGCTMMGTLEEVQCKLIRAASMALEQC